MTLSLYKATYLAQLQNHIDPGTGEIDYAAFEAAGITLAERQLACVAWYKNEKYSLAAMKAAIDDAQSAYRKRAVVHDGFADYLKLNMQATGTTEIKSNDGMFSAKLWVGRDKSVTLDDGVVFDECYLAPPKPREPSKTLIKAAIEAGIDVVGASIVRRDRLEIK